MEQGTGHKNIYIALNAAMQECGYVQKKRDEKSQLTYTFAGEAALIAAIRPVLVAHGITVMPSGVRELRSELYTTAKGAVMNRTLGIFAFHFHHGESETGFDVEVLGEASDSGDKSAAKAMTIALKYALRQTMLIETGDDPDEFGSEDQERGSGKQNGNAPKVDPDEYANTIFATYGDRIMNTLTTDEINAVKDAALIKSGVSEQIVKARALHYFGNVGAKKLEYSVKEFIGSLCTPVEVE